MVKYIIVAASMLCLTLSACVSAKSDYIYAGTAKVDISPDQAVISADGEAFRLPDTLGEGEKTPPGNIHDPLYARVLILKNKDVSLAIVSTDLIVFSSKRVVDEAKKLWGIDHVILSSTYTHAGMVPRKMCPVDGGWEWYFKNTDPDELFDWAGFSEDPWYAATEEKVISAIGEAARNLFVAKISAGQGPVKSDYLAHNRRLVNPDGTVTMMWDNPNRTETKPLDPTVRVVRIDDTMGNPRVLLTHYACHPAMMIGAGSITRDYPGTTVDYIEEKMGDSCMAMFLQGAAGDIDPYELSLRGEAGFEKTRLAGVSLGESAMNVAETLPASQEDGETSICVKEGLINIPHRVGDGTSDVCLTTVVINKDLALVTMPGAPFIQHQLNLSEKSPVANTLLLGLTYSGEGSPYLMYVPTAQAVKEGGRGAEDCNFLSADAGDRMVNAALASVRELLEK